MTALSSSERGLQSWRETPQLSSQNETMAPASLENKYDDEVEHKLTNAQGSKMATNESYQDDHVKAARTNPPVQKKVLT